MPDEAELGRLLEDAAASPEENLLDAERRHLLHQAVLRIPAPLRIVLVLHDTEELTTEQVARILDLQPGTVRVRLHRARLAVRKQMSRVLAGSEKSNSSQSSSKSLQDGSNGQQNRSKAPENSSKSQKNNPKVEKNNAKGKRGGSKSQPHPRLCRELFAGLSDYLDGRLEPRTCEEMRAQIEACPACVAFLQDLRQAIDRCRALEVPCEPAVQPRLRSLLTQEYLRMSGAIRAF
jgi:RNA polymerase sigma-70 factor (ECF subfamily)